MTDIAKLKELALAAIAEEGDDWYAAAQFSDCDGLNLGKADAKFIAAANPAAVLELIERLERAEAKFKEMLEAEHRLSDAYIRIRQIAGTINIPPGSDIWAETEKAISALVGRAETAEANYLDEADYVKQLKNNYRAIESKLAELEKQKAAGFVEAPGKAKLFYHGKDLPVDAKLYTRPAPAVNLAELVPEDISSRLFALPMMDKAEGDELLCDIHAWLTPLILRNIEEARK